MGKALHVLLQEELKKPKLPEFTGKALHLGGSVEPKKKGKSTGQFKMFMEIAARRAVNGEVICKHMDTKGKVCTKPIALCYLKPENFDHVLPK